MIGSSAIMWIVFALVHIYCKITIVNHKYTDGLNLCRFTFVSNMLWLWFTGAADCFRIYLFIFSIGLVLRSAPSAEYATRFFYFFLFYFFFLPRSTILWRTV